jgi:hypothetical protein
MRTSKYLVRAMALAAAALWGVTAAQASTTFTIGNGGLETFTLTWDGHTESALAGGIYLTYAGGANPPGSFNTVCTDIGATVYLGQNYIYSAPAVFGGLDGILPSWGAGNAGIPLGTLWGDLTDGQRDNASAAIQAAADIYYDHQGVLTDTSDGYLSRRAALQLAVWEALYDTTAGSTAYSLTGDRFSVSSGDLAARNLAATWLSQVDVNARYAGYLLIPDPQNQHGLYSQEMLYNVTPVPEPTTMIAGALLLLPFGASTLRVLRRNRAA